MSISICGATTEETEEVTGAGFEADADFALYLPQSQPCLPFGSVLLLLPLLLLLLLLLSKDVSSDGLRCRI